jgi:O-antigen ligase
LDKIRGFLLYIFIFSLSIENWSPWGNKTDLFRPSLIIVFFYVILSCFNFNVNFNTQNIKKIFHPSILLWFWLFMGSFFSFLLYENINFHFNYTLFSCIILFLLIFNDLSRFPRMYINFLIVILFNGIFLSLLFYFNIGIEIGYMGRMTLLGNNPNILSFNSVISIVIIFYFVFENPQALNKYRFLLLIFIPLLLQNIALTGSKGGLLLLLFSTVFYFIFLDIPKKYKIISYILGIIFCALFYILIFQNNVIASRWTGFITTGDSTGRLVRWIYAFKIFQQNPIFGISENLYSVTKSPFFGGNDPHNVYLYILATGGILGFILLFIILKNILNYSIQSRHNWKSIFPVLLFILLFLHWFKAGGGLNSKLVWSYFSLVVFKYKNNNIL